MTERSWRRIALLVALVATAGPGAARADTLKVGSPLAGSYVPTPLGGPGTFAFRTLDERGALLVSPVSGTVVSWRFAGAIGGPFRLRILRVNRDGIGAAAGSSAPVVPAGTGTTPPLPTSLPIAAGESIGIDNSSVNDRLGSKVPTTSATFYAWYPPLTDGGPSRGGQPGAGELGFNAVVRYCRVPDVLGKRLGVAKRSLRASDCTPPRGKPGPKRLVAAQSPAAGTAVSDRLRVKVSLRARGRRDPRRGR